MAAISSDMDLMPIFGVAEWPGQLLSLLASASALLTLLVGLCKRYGAMPALASVAFVATDRGLVTLATCVQPDSLMLFCLVMGWARFPDFVDTEDAGHSFRQ